MTQNPIPSSKMSSLVFRLSFIITILLGFCHSLTYDVTEEILASGTYVGNIPVDADLESLYDPAVFAQLRYNFFSSDAGEEETSLFTIEETTGVLRTNGQIDREHICQQQVNCPISLSVAVTPTENLRIIEVTINIIDFNDHLPMFANTVISLEVSEEEAVGFKLPLPQAEDGDSPIFGIDHYQLVTDSSKFELETKTLPNGLLSLNLVLQEPLDHEDVNMYHLRLVAYDGGDPASTGFVDIDIAVLDSNDNIPAFENSTYMVTVPEDISLNTTIITVVATDEDQGQYGKVIYGFAAGSEAEQQVFGINADTGALYVKTQLDYESQKTYTVLLSASNMDPGSEAVYATVFVSVLDINDNGPRITMNVLPPAVSAQVSEDDPTGTFVAHLSVSDPDSDVNGQFECSLQSDSFTLLELETAGQYKVVTAREFDHEDEPTYLFEVHCNDLGEEPQSSVKAVLVTILDINDNDPVFSQEQYVVTMAENNHVNAYICQVNATDADSGANGALTYWLDGDMANLFEIDEFTGVIHTLIIFDYETMREFMFNVIAQDGGDPSKFATATVIVSIQDQNDEPPRFDQSEYTFNVLENKPVGMEIGIVSATDDDTDSTHDYFEYSLVGTPSLLLFAVDTNTGHVRTRASLDRELRGVYELIVTATNVRSEVKLSSTAVIRIIVDDDNDNPPLFDFPSQRNYTLQISSDTPEGVEIGYLRAHDLDEGQNAAFSFAIISANHPNVFNVNPSNGRLQTVKDMRDIDDDIFDLNVRVTDQGFPPLATDAILTVIVNNSIGYYGAVKPQGSLIAGNNLIIVVSLGVISVIVITALVVAIFIVFYKNQQAAKQRQYDYRVSGIQGWTETNPGAKAGPADHSIDGALLLKDGGFNTSHDSSTPNSDGHVVSNQGSFSLNNLRDPPTQYQGNHSFRSDNLATAPNIPMDTKSNKLWELSVKQLQPQPWYAERPESDNASASSGEVSNADSGRGASEEGENSLMNASMSMAGIRRLPPQVAHGNSNMAPPPRRLGHKHPASHSQSYQEPHMPSQYVTFLASRTKRSNSDTDKQAANRHVHSSESNLYSDAPPIGPKPPKKGGRHRHASPTRGQTHFTIPEDDLPGSKGSMDRWDRHSDVYGDGGSSTSGSYVLELDSKDLDSEPPPFSSVVV